MVIAYSSWPYRWLSMVLETVGNLLTFSVSVAFVASRDESKSTLAAGFAGLVISYTLNITQGLSWFVRMATEVETNVVSVERIGEYSNLTIEVCFSSLFHPAFRHHGR